MTASIVLRGPQLEALEFLVDGSFDPANEYCLPGTKPESWPVEPTLVIPGDIGDLLVVSDRITLTDPENTPLAVVNVSEVEARGDGTSWVAGKVERVKRPEHGPARDRRHTAGRDFSGRVAALFSVELHAVDVLRAEREAQGRPLELIAMGGDDAAASSRLVSNLEECAELLHDARVSFVPAADFATPLGVDVASHLADRAGAADILDFRRSAPRTRNGAVILLTGLSGAGKSTVARALTERISAATDVRTVLLDGDDVRHELAGELGFSRDDRDRNLQRIAWVAARVAQVGGIAVCAPIAPFEASRLAMREKVEPNSPFIVVYVSTPLAVAEARDRKGLYEKARAGLIKDFTGIDSPYEVPREADVVLDTSQLSVDTCVDEIFGLLHRRGVVA